MGGKTTRELEAWWKISKEQGAEEQRIWDTFYTKVPIETAHLRHVESLPTFLSDQSHQISIVACTKALSFLYKHVINALDSY